MTESEIMKALECCSNPNGFNGELCESECPYKNRCYDKENDIDFLRDVIALLNRKNAEIDELQHEKAELQHKIEKLNLENLQMLANIKGLKAEAIKELAEMVGDNGFAWGREIKQIAKEMGVEL